MLMLMLPPLPTALAGWPAYSLFYLLGFGLAGGLLLGEGWQRGFPLRPWLLLVACTVLALMAGTRIIAGGVADWQMLLSRGHWGAGGPVGRSVLGGMLGAGLALAGLRRLLGFGREAADAFARPFALGLAVQGVGCLLGGCCFGEVLGHAPGLGLTYGPGTEPFRAQVAQGLLPATAAHTLPVHAAQLYQILLCLGIAGVLTIGRRGLARRPGRALPLAFGLYAAGRFGLEFVRDPLGDVVGAGIWLGLKPVQWGLLVAALALAALVARSSRSEPAGPPPADRPLPNLVLVLLVLVLPPVLLPGGFDLGETLVLRALLLPVLALEAVRLLRVVRPLPAALLALSGAMMSQIPADTTDRAGAAPGRSLTLGLGGLTGRSYQLYADPNSCGTPRQDITQFPGYHQRYTGATGSAMYSVPVGASGQRTVSFGLHGFIGRTAFDPPAFRPDQYSRSDTLAVPETVVSRVLYDVSPTLEYFSPGRPGHSTRVRLGMGLHLSGQYAFDWATEPLRSRRPTPSLLLELGYRNLLWLHSSAVHGADAVGNGTWRLGLGTGFGRDHLTLLGGLATTNSNGQNEFNLFGGPNYYAPSSAFGELRWQVSPTWLVEGSALGNFNDVTRFTLGTRYRLPLPAKK